MYAAERRAALAQRLGAHGRVSVVEAADELGVSGETIRRDLAALERSGVARRVHGGAVARSAVQAVEQGLREREGQRVVEKSRIAAAALDLLPAPGGSMIVDAGTSTSAFVELLPGERSVVAFAHGIVTAALLAQLEHVDLHVVGGHVRGTTAAAVGTDTVAAYRRIGVDVAFIGANGISPERGLTTADFEEAAVKRAILHSARRTVVLADSSKIDQDFIVTFGAVEDVDVLVTDDEADPSAVARLRDLGVEVVLA